MSNEKLSLVVPFDTMWQPTMQLRWSKDGVLQQLWIGQTETGVTREWQDVAKEEAQ